MYHSYFARSACAEGSGRACIVGEDSDWLVLAGNGGDKRRPTWHRRMPAAGGNFGGGLIALLNSQNFKRRGGEEAS